MAKEGYAPSYRLRRWSSFFGAWIAAAIFLGVCLMVDPLGAFSVDGQLTLEGWVYAFVFLLVPLVILQLVAAPLLKIERGRWMVRNPVRRWSFSEASVVALSDSSWGYPRIELDGGTSIVVAALEETSLSEYLGNVPMIDRLEAARADSSTGSAGSQVAIRKAWSPPYWGVYLVVAIWVGYVCFVLTQGPYGSP